MKMWFIKAKKLFDISKTKKFRTALRKHHVAAGVEHMPVLFGLGCLSVIDIGANRGQFSLTARHCFPEATIVSFEPLRGPAESFRKLFENDNKVILHEIAIGPQTGDTIIHISGCDDSSSLLPINPLQGKYFPGTQEVGTEAVKIGVLKDYVPVECIRHPALLKLDVQGYELSALKGCEELLQKFTYIYAECSFVELYSGQVLADEVIAWLREHGFVLKGVYNTVYSGNGTAIQADCLFSNKTALAGDGISTPSAIDKRRV